MIVSSNENSLGNYYDLILLSNENRQKINAALSGSVLDKDGFP